MIEKNHILYPKLLLFLIFLNGKQKKQQLIH